MHVGETNFVNAVNPESKIIAVMKFFSACYQIDKLFLNTINHLDLQCA